MNQKKTAIFIVALLLFSLVLTGCGADEVGFLNHLSEIQEMSTTKPTQTVSKISVSNINLPTEIMSADKKEIVQAITSFFDDYYITITQTADPQKNISSTSFDTIKKLDNNSKKENLFTINYKDEALAISTGPKFSQLPLEAQMMINPYTNKLIPLSSFMELLGGQPLALSSLSNRDAVLNLNNKSMTYLKELGKVYSSMDTQLITKDAAHGGSYLFQMDAPEFATFLNEFVSITLQNTNNFFMTTSNFIESLTEEEFNLLYGQLFPSGKAEMIALFKVAMEEPIPEEVSETWNTMYDSEIGPAIISTMEGSSASMRTWKDNNNYYTNLYGMFKMSIPGAPNMKLSTTILITEEIKIISDDFDVTMPTDVISDSLIKSILPVPAPVQIETVTTDTDVTPLEVTP